MIEIILRVSGNKFDVKKFLNCSGWKVICSWEKGKIDPIRKKEAKNTGFNMDIFSSKNYSQISYERGISKIIDFITKNNENLKYLQRNKVATCIDIGIIEEKIFLIQANLKGEILKLASKYNLELVVSVYP